VKREPTNGGGGGGGTPFGKLCDKSPLGHGGIGGGCGGAAAEMT
jgi:hypothetical protein